MSNENSGQDFWSRRKAAVRKEEDKLESERLKAENDEIVAELEEKSDEEILDELGLEAPKTWDDVVAIGQVMKEKKPDVGPLAMYFKHDGNRQNLFVWLNFLWGNGAAVFDDNNCPA